jgi:hypothetical protein
MALISMVNPKTQKAAVLSVCGLLENSADIPLLVHFLQTTVMTTSHGADATALPEQA